MCTKIFFAYFIVAEKKPEYILEEQGSLQESGFIASCIRSHLPKFFQPVDNVLWLQGIPFLNMEI